MTLDAGSGFLVYLDPVAVGVIVAGDVDHELRRELEALRLPPLLLLSDPGELEQGLVDDADTALGLVWDAGAPFEQASTVSELLRGLGGLASRLAEVVQDVRFAELANRDRPAARAYAYKAELMRQALLARRTGAPAALASRLLTVFGLSDAL